MDDPIDLSTLKFLIIKLVLEIKNVIYLSLCIYSLLYQNHLPFEFHSKSNSFNFSYIYKRIYKYLHYQNQRTINIYYMVYLMKFVCCCRYVHLSINVVKVRISNCDKAKLIYNNLEWREYALDYQLPLQLTVTVSCGAASISAAATSLAPPVNRARVARR